MITLSRRQARRLRVIFLRSVLGLGPRVLAPPLVLRNDGNQLRAEWQFAGVALAFVEPASAQDADAVAVPIDALAEFEGREESPVTLEAVAPDRTIARWDDHGVPQSRDDTVVPITQLAAFPDMPARWSTAPASLLDALADAAETTCDDSPRYNLACVQLQGGSGRIIATDGCQLLIQGGFGFPWKDDVLIRRSRVFGTTAFPRDRSVNLGKTSTHVVIQCEGWTLAWEIQTARFPRVEGIVPVARQSSARLQLDPADAVFLGEVLSRLPGGDDANAPVTIDLNGSIAVRAKGPEQAAATELILDRSQRTGPAARFATNRQFLARALRMGISEIEVPAAGSPIVGRQAHRVFAWQPLNKDSVLDASPDAIRIACPSSPSRPRTSSVGTTRIPKPEGATPVTSPTQVIKSRSTPSGATNGHAPRNESPVASGMADLIQEAKALHESLSQARSRAHRLVMALRRRRKHDRLVTNTLASLRELKLQEAVG